MGAYKSTARAIGILFIIASAAAIIGGTLALPATEADFLSEAAGSESQVVIGLILEVVLALAVFGMAALFFPILKKQDEGLALGYVGTRIVEGVLIVAGTVSAALMLALSKGFGPDGSAAGVEPVGEVLFAAREWTYWLGPMAVFSVSALILNWLLYRSRVVPTWISIWGFVGGLLLLASAVIEMFGQALGWWQAIFTAPIGVNEMVLALWLIVKGFDMRHLEPERTPTRELVGAGAGEDRR
jgi:MFS family permease